MRQEQDRLRHMTNDALGETGLVLVDQRHDVASRNVVMIDDGETGAIEIAANADDFAGRNGRSNGASEEQTRKREIVEVLRAPGHFRNALFPEDVCPDRTPPGHAVDYTSRLRPPSREALRQDVDDARRTESGRVGGARSGRMIEDASAPHHHRRVIHHQRRAVSGTAADTTRRKSSGSPTPGL